MLGVFVINSTCKDKRNSGNQDITTRNLSFKLNNFYFQFTCCFLFVRREVIKGKRFNLQLAWYVSIPVPFIKFSYMNATTRLVWWVHSWKRRSAGLSVIFGDFFAWEAIVSVVKIKNSIATRWDIFLASLNVSGRGFLPCPFTCPLLSRLLNEWKRGKL